MKIVVTGSLGNISKPLTQELVQTGADAVYCMIPPNNYFDHTLDLPAYYQRLAHNYAQAVQQSGVKRVVYLSSIGDHLEQGSGILIGHHKGEGILNNLADVGITFMRPVAFHYKLYGYVEMIKNQGFIAANYGADDPDPLHPPNSPVSDTWLIAR